MKIIFFTGSGISQESGIPTFRDRIGLWNQFNPDLIASKNSWKNNKADILSFHNQMRDLVNRSEPNKAHLIISSLEQKHDVTVITQNIDDLHERAGSTKVLHLHGNIMESRSSLNPKLIYPCNRDIVLGDKCEKGSQLRPNVVWFKEKLDENLIIESQRLLKCADIIVVVGTSLDVYPANDLIYKLDETSKLYVVDPRPPELIRNRTDVEFIIKKASEGLIDLVAQL